MRAYSDVVGVRTRQLDRQLDKIEDLSDDEVDVLLDAHRLDKGKGNGT